MRQRTRCSVTRDTAAAPQAGNVTASEAFAGRLNSCVEKTMCNNYEQRVTWRMYRDAVEALDLGTPTDQGEADLPQADDIRIGDMGPVMRAAGNGIELAPMKFGLPPASPRWGSVFNFRSEGRHFDKSNRCLIPASAFFEFTGKKYPKAKHRFTLSDGPFLAIAGIWREGKDGDPPAFTMLTTAPGEDVAPYHARQIVVLAPQEWTSWVYLTKPEGVLLRPLAKGALQVETVRPGSD